MVVGVPRKHSNLCEGQGLSANALIRVESVTYFLPNLHVVGFPLAWGAGTLELASEFLQMYFVSLLV